MTATTQRNALSRYRAALMIQVITILVLLTIAPVWIVTYQFQDPATTFSMVGILLAWWGAFIASYVYNGRLQAAAVTPAVINATR